MVAAARPDTQAGYREGAISPGKTHQTEARGTRVAQSPPADADLTAVVSAWSSLDAGQRAAVLSVVRSMAPRPLREGVYTA